MRTIRVHLDMPLHVGAEIALPDDAAQHLVRVLRLQPGDGCVVFDGHGHEFDARVVSAGKRDVLAAIVSAREVRNESPLALVLLQGIARGDRMDLILQKATELGVHAVHPVSSQRSEVKLDAERAAKRVAHWRGVVVAACEQSGRATVPRVAEPVALGDAFGALPAGGTRLLLDPVAKTSLATVVIDPDAPVVLAIGPEGGWSPLDHDRLLAAGFIGLRLGPRVLRTETAGLAAIAALQARFGDLG